MSQEPNIKTESAPSLDDFGFLSAEAYCHYLDRDRVSAYFASYERQENPDPRDQARYLELKYYHNENKWFYLNQLADLFLTQNKESLALMCWAESLRLNSKQGEVFLQVNALRNSVVPAACGPLKGNTCSVSVIMATYNRTEDARESIESVLNQTFQDFELVVINDGGSDDIHDILQSYQSPKIKYYKLPENRGLSAALNFGIQMAEGKYIAYLDDDDLYYDHHLENLFTVLANSPFKLVYGNMQGVEGERIEGNFAPQEVKFVWSEDFDKDLLASHIYISPCSTMHEKGIFHEVGLFNQDLHMSMDWDFWLRCAKKFDFKHVRGDISEYRLHTNNSVNNRVDAYFFGGLVCRYHALYSGDVSLMKYYFEAGKKQKAREMYDSIRGRYKSGFKTEESVDELLHMAEAFNDKGFMIILSGECLLLSFKNCIKYAVKSKSIWILFGIMIQIPRKCIRIANSHTQNIGQRIAKLIKGISNLKK